MALVSMSGGTRFLPGQLVRARGRDWVVLPSDSADVVRLRPVDGYEDEAIGVASFLAGSALKPATYAPPSPEGAGDLVGALLLRDAARLTLRSGAGPFRSLGHVAVTPRPYQFVPLIMALRLSPVRLLIADDVGVGKTIEAAMVARELLDRGVARRIGVLCPPHLCDQWEAELREKFGIEATVVQPSRMARLERDLPRPDVHVFQHYRHLVASIDYMKGRLRDSFVANSPDLIIVDEAHSAARPSGNRRGSQQQRHELLRLLSRDRARHLLLVSATPHSGLEESFRSLLGLLDPMFDVSPEVDVNRRALVPHLVQRRRRDLEHWLGTDTPFPERKPQERQYGMSADYQRLYEDVVDYCRETVAVAGSAPRQQQRVRYWAAIGILRCVLSSPAAAEAVLSNRAERLEDGDDAGDPDVLFSQQVLDFAEDVELPPDYAPTAPVDAADAVLDDSERRRLDSLLRRARDLGGTKKDWKLAEVVAVAEELLANGFHPIVYCRFIATANYLAEEFRKALRVRYSDIDVVAVTGEVGDEQRRELVERLGNSSTRVLVATDCLSEGINLQETFDAVVHYDLPWNPNRLEQREGRVDRYGQPRAEVRTVLLYGADNAVDLTVLDVLIRKARTIRARLGVSMPIPVESEQVVQAVVDSVLLGGRPRGQQLALGLADPKVSVFHAEWERAANKLDAERAFFSQHQISPHEVARELQELEPALGNEQDVERFIRNALVRFNGELRLLGKQPGVFELHPGDLKDALRHRDASLSFPLRVAFEGQHAGAMTLVRNHPVVAVIADSVLADGLMGSPSGNFARCGAVYTTEVTVRTCVCVLRLRYLLREEDAEQFAEEVVVAGFKRESGELVWLEPAEDDATRLLGSVRVSANMPFTEKQRQVAWALGELRDGWWEGIVARRVEALSAAHARLRGTIRGKPLAVRPHTPPDILGCYVLVPGAQQ